MGQRISALMKKKQIPILILLLTLFFQLAPAQVQLNDGAKITLLTASPWYEAVYAYFGHTAIRVLDDSTGVDAVFNYGYFDSSQPNFMYHFIRGETDYILGVITFEQFIAEYGLKGQEVVEQELNLLPEEKNNLYRALVNNALPENRGYRYNYFYDNCATRPRDMVENYTKGKIIYPSTAREQSYRDLVHEHVNHSRWIKFGIDLLIGGDADRIIDVREKMYIPSYLMNSFQDAVVHREDTVSLPLVSKTNVILERDPQINTPRKDFPVSPMVAAIILLILSILVSIVQTIKLDKTRLPVLFDTILFGVAGIGGLVVMVLMFFSEHPATNPNWNFAWLHPFSLLIVPLFWSKRAGNIVYLYHLINFVVLIAFLVIWWLIPQQLPIETIPFALCLWLRSAIHLNLWRRERVINRRYASSRSLKRGWGI